MIGECLCVWLWTSVWDRFGQPTNSRSIYVHKTTTTTTTTTKTEKSSTFRPIIHWWRIYFIIHISLNHYGHIWMISLAYLTCWSRSHRSHLYIWWYADTGTDTFTSATIKVPFTHTHTQTHTFLCIWWRSWCPFIPTCYIAACFLPLIFSNVFVQCILPSTWQVND